MNTRRVDEHLAPAHPGVSLAVRATTLIALSLLFAAYIASVAGGVPNLFLEDDAYFYLQIAWNIGAGHGSTFDGVNVTNGYHLLWMAVLAPLASVVHAVGFGKPAFLFAVCSLSIAIAVFSVASAFRTLPERILAFLLFVLGGITMEATLLAAVMLLIVRRLWGELEVSALPLFLLALLVPLARIDFFWLPVGLALAMLPSPQKRTAFRSVAIGTLVGVALHFAVERWLFDTWTSVSSAYKADALNRAGVRLFLENLSSSGNLLRCVVLATFAVLGVWGAWRQRSRRTPLVAAIAVATMPVIGYLALTSLRDWYFTASLLTTMLLASRQWVSTSRVWRAGMWATAFVVGAACTTYLLMYREDRDKTAQFATEANATLLPTDVVFLTDGSGFIGWRLNAHVVNGDGLVNSWAYRRMLMNDALGPYLSEIHATHLITNAPEIRRPLISWHGLQVDDAPLLIDTGPTRNRFERYRLFALQ